MSYRYALCALFFISTVHAMELEKGQVLVPEKLGQLAVIHHGNKFYVDRNGETKQVQNCFIDKGLRGISRDKLESFLANNGYVSLSQMSDGEYVLRSRGRLNGGGPVAGAIGYWLTKSLCYGAAVAAAGTAVVATGGVAGAVTGAAVTGATLGVGAGASVAAGAIAGAGAAEGAALVTAGVVTGAGGIAGAVAAVESASLGVGTALTLCPFLP